MGCSRGESSEDPDGDSTTAPIELDVVLDAELGVGAPTGPDYPPDTSGLVAEYTVTNNADVAVLVVERRPAQITPTVDVPLPDTEESSWVYSDDAGTVLVTKEIFATSRSSGTDRNTGSAYRAPAVRLEPGESVTGPRLRPNPVAPDSAQYRRLRRAGAEYPDDPGDVVVILCTDGAGPRRRRRADHG
ncbi:hypothetical protein [Phytoactinopolyspora halophila]|nr:hypothetical protein [Phytoactinopolyspora halophila]